MEELQGYSLSSLLAFPKHAIGSFEKRLSIAQQLVRAIHYCHQKGVIHADIKPENFIIQKRNQLVLFDFGISTMPGRQSTQLQHDKIQAGSSRYVAPELCHNKPPSKASDQFSVCCIIYHLLEGSPPYSGHKADKANLKKIPPMSTVDDTLFSIIRQGLSANPKNRCPSLTPLIEALNTPSQTKPSKPTKKKSLFSSLLNQIQ